jgi:hypothetical protein
MELSGRAAASTIISAMNSRSFWRAASCLLLASCAGPLWAADPVPAAAPASASAAAPTPKYRNFAVSIYIPVSIVRTFSEAGRLEREWDRISRQLKVDKVYVESQRDRQLASEDLLERVKAFFVAHGVRVAGGITFSDGGMGQFRSFCYTDPADRDFVKRATELTARHFDEIILDDFFFVTTKYPSDVAAKGNRSWTEFRLALMNDAGRELVVNAARAINPKARVIIKYPNWYEHFAGLGFDLAEGPKIFHGVYSGTETRDPSNTDQFLQQYESYQIIRYFENIAPGRNGGGWVDTYSMSYVDRFAEQLWDTVFAKAPEMTLFEWSGMLQPAAPGARATWKEAPTSFNYDQMIAYRPDASGSSDAGPASFARVAGYSLDQVDAFLGKLGKPIGIKSYRPPHATGDDFLHNFLGMIGIPIDLYPTFPADADVVLLTEAARSDPDLVAKIRQQLDAGKTVVATASLYRALQGHGIEQIVELEPTERRILADGYSTGFGPGSRANLKNDVTGAPPILFPQIRFLTNDAWSLVSAMSDGLGFPLLIMDHYGKHGTFYVWNIPDNFHHLYRLPVPVVSAIKDVVMEHFPVRLDGPSEVALFAYDNDTFIVQSFLSGAAEVKIGTLSSKHRLRDLVSGETIDGVPPPQQRGRRYDHAEHRSTFEVHVAPHSYRVFALEP